MRYLRANPARTTEMRWKQRTMRPPDGPAEGVGEVIWWDVGWQRNICMV